MNDYDGMHLKQEVITMWNDVYKIKKTNKKFSA
jgi:hypothetical protein